MEGGVRAARRGDLATAQVRLRRGEALRCKGRGREGDAAGVGEVYGKGSSACTPAVRAGLISFAMQRGLLEVREVNHFSAVLRDSPVLREGPVVILSRESVEPEDLCIHVGRAALRTAALRRSSSPPTVTANTRLCSFLCALNARRT